MARHWLLWLVWLMVNGHASAHEGAGRTLCDWRYFTLPVDPDDLGLVNSHSSYSLTLTVRAIVFYPLVPPLTGAELTVLLPGEAALESTQPVRVRVRVRVRVSQVKLPSTPRYKVSTRWRSEAQARWLSGGLFQRPGHASGRPNLRRLRTVGRLGPSFRHGTHQAPRAGTRRLPQASGPGSANPWALEGPLGIGLGMRALVSTWRAGLPSGHEPLR